jgi:hypothetical protein
MNNSTEALKSPFPFFGGKRRVGHLVWQRFGDVQNYVEPFAGSLAVLLSRPSSHFENGPRTETVNDIDCFISNFWRALADSPECVAHHADWPVNEADLHARHLWLVNQVEFRERMKSDPEFYDAKIAGWWVWGICQWIGSGWCDSGEVRQLPHLADGGQGGGRPAHKLPHLGDQGRGITRPSQKLPIMGNGGVGVHRRHLTQQLPHLGNAGTGDTRSGMNGGLLEYMSALSTRLRRVRVACGDWSRVTGPSVTFKHGTTGVFLDPPYSLDERASVYSNESDCATAVREWAIENGSNKLMRIALCGYEGEHAMPDDWECVAWKAPGGYGSQGNERGRDNCERERIWFSPACLKPNRNQLAMF